jgi:hypothetical protein
MALKTSAECDLRVMGRIYAYIGIYSTDFFEIFLEGFEHAIKTMLKLT